MTAQRDTPSWLHVPKGRSGPKVSTATQVTLWANGTLSIPSAAYDALGIWQRVHLFVSEERPGWLWLVPAEDDDEDAYRLSTRPREYSRRLTASDLVEKLHIDPDLDVVRGDWKILDDQIIVVFDVGKQP